MKQLIEELEVKVEEARAKGVEDDTADRRAAEARDGKNKKKVIKFYPCREREAKRMFRGLSSG